MMIGNGAKIKLAALLVTSTLVTNLVCADTYKNNVVDVKLNKESGNAVKITIYTDKPYTEPVVVNKKANNKYVILMPETKSSLKCSPTVSNMSGTVSDVSVNTQEGSGGKGYTKITVTSQKPITVVPQTQQFTKSKNPQTTASTSSNVKKTVAKPAATSVSKLTTSKTSVSTSKTSSATTSTTKTNKPVQTTKQTTNTVKQQTKTAIKPVTTNVNTTKKSVTTNTTKPVQQTAKQVQPAVKPVPAKKPIEILEQEVKNNTNASNAVQDKNDKILNNEIKENIAKQEKELTEQEKNNKNNVSINDTDSSNKSTVDNIKTVKKSYNGVSFWKILLLLGAILFPILVIMAILGMDKNINKKIDESFHKKEDFPELKEEPDIEETYEDVVPIVPPIENETNIQDTPVITPVITDNDDESQETVYSSFDEMLDNVEEPAQSYHEEYLQQNNPELAIQNEEENKTFENDYDDSDFENEQEPVVSAEEDTIIDNEQTEKTPDTNISELPAENVIEDSINLADFGEVSDSDFFSELAMQTMAADNANGLPEQLPADDIFDFMTEDDVSDNDNSVVGDSPKQETMMYGDDLTMLTEVKLNDDSGLYLVNYENFSSLVGHIKEDYFVIKKFDDIVNDRIYLKETEKLKDSTRYLVRVGKNKMVVEVSDTSMSRLLDL